MPPFCAAGACRPSNANPIPPATPNSSPAAPGQEQNVGAPTRCRSAVKNFPRSCTDCSSAAFCLGVRTLRQGWHGGGLGSLGERARRSSIIALGLTMLTTGVNLGHEAHMSG